MAGGEIQGEGEAGVRGKDFDYLQKGFEAAGGGADADDGVEKMGFGARRGEAGGGRRGLATDVGGRVCAMAFV